MTKTSNDNRTEGRRVFLRSTLGIAGVSLLESPALAMKYLEASTGDGLHSASMMSTAADAFISSLSADQRAKAAFAFEDEQRLDWHFIPRPRKGIPFKELDATQRLLGNALMSTGLGQRGLIRATTIMSLDAILRELEQGKGPVRDPELYFLSIFGDARSGNRWGWRVEGHHVSLNFTLVEGKHIASTPAFFGANPAEVLEGARKGLRELHQH